VEQSSRKIGIEGAGNGGNFLGTVKILAVKILVIAAE
jgi:hypothetical protein